MKKNLFLILLLAVYLVQSNLSLAHTKETFESESSAIADKLPNFVNYIPDANGILYVKKGATGNGSAWNNALGELADALKFAKTNNATTTNPQVSEIWVAKGTYKPLYRADNLDGADATDRNNAFVLINKVEVYGGFPDIGNPAMINRNFTTNPTVLSGNLDVNIAAYHVVISVGTQQETVLDGFIITGGNANGTGINAITVNQKTIYQANGGGMYNAYSSASIKNCIFHSNTTLQRGGAMVNDNASPIISNCSFMNNNATDVNNAYAGAMYNSSSNPVITNCIFDGNTGTRYGGAMHNTSSAPIIVNSIFKNNRTTSSFGNGGAVYNQNSSSSKFTNTLFYNNFANGSGGAFYNDGSAPSVTNCTFYGNTVSSHSLNGQSVFTNGNNFALNNSILWVNDSFIADGVLSGSVTGANNFIQQTGGPPSNPVAAYTAAQLFTDAPNGNLTLKANSPAINAGNNAVVNTFTDLAGNSRTRDNKVDIGAYEVQSGNTIVSMVPAANGTLYVKQGSAGNGSSWANAAAELADALLAAKGNAAIKQIWVAKGTYKPLYKAAEVDNGNVPTTDRDKAFVLVKDVKLYGGFAGAETDISQRDLTNTANATTLSGDLGTAGNTTDNAYHVLISAGDAGTAELNGFTLTGGNADGSNIIMVNGNTVFRYWAGGMYNYRSSPTLSNVTLSNNTATYGGGMFNDNSSPTLSNVMLSNNTATNNGGGMFNIISSPTLSNVTLSNNRATNYGGGGMYNDRSSPTLSSVTLSNNTATSNGGAMYNDNSSPTISQSKFIGNTAADVGGAMFNNVNSSVKVSNSSITGNKANWGGAVFKEGGGTDTFLNCTLAGNYASNDGGGINTKTAGSITNLSNTIVYGNTNGSQASDIRNDGGAATINVNYSSYGVVTGTIAGGNNKANTDPKFTDAASGDYTLKTVSPAIGAGNNSLYTNNGGNLTADKDLAGSPRLTGSNVDMGAYEDQTIVLQPNATGIVYVSQNGAGSFNGSSWANAAPELADALLAAKTNTAIKQIWVAKGTYKPLHKAAEVDENNVLTTDRDKAFVLVKDVKLYGGFVGTEANIGQRDLTNTANATTLSGDLGTAGNITDNAYHVVISAGDAGTVELNGFTITGGNAEVASKISVNGVEVYRSFGGGMYNFGSSPALSNVTLSNNTAGFGGGMYNASSSPTLSNVTLSNNIAGFGGAMSNDSSSPTLSNVTLSNNTATSQGGGMYNDRSFPILNNVTLSNNTATSHGGAMYNFFSSPTISQSKFTGNTTADAGGAMYNNFNSSVKVSNSSITGNTANWGGAIFKENAGNDTFLNCTIAGNYASNDGGGINTKTANTTTNLINTIVYGNTKATGSQASDIRNDDGNATIYLNYSSYGVVTGTIAGGNNKANTDPKFTDAANGDYTLKTVSPAIGAGDNSLYTGNINTDKDLAGSPRLTGTTIDMGAYEALVQSQTINPIAAITKTYGDVAFEPGATASSGLTVAYLSADNSIAEAYQDTADGNKWKIRIKKAGMVNLTASQVGDASYEPAADVVFSLMINKKPVNISLLGTPAISKVYDGNTNATISAANLAFVTGDVISGDQLNIALSNHAASYGTADAGTAKAVTVPLANISLSGTSLTNYSLANTLDVTANVGEITKLAITGISFVNASFPYDATSKSLAITGTLPAGAMVNYIGNGQTDAGSYTVTANISGGINYQNQSLTAQLTINKAQITGISFADGVFDYNGTAKSLAITGTLPAGATVSYVGNGQSDAGTYTVTATINGGANYQDQTLTAQLIINKAQITGISFAGGSFVYDGTAKSLAITGTLPAGTTVTYTGNAQINAGTYTVTAKINGGTTYEDQTLTAMLSINKALITGINLADANFSYDGTAKSLAISGTLPAGATVTFTGNNNTNAGVYLVTATINGGSNYQNQILSANLTINKAPLTITANNALMCQGSSIPAFAASYSGFKNGESQSNLTTRPNLSTTANSSSAAGNYAITASGASSTNYEITYVSGSLTITALPTVAITSNSGNSISKGTTVTLTATGGTSYTWTGEGIISGQGSVALTIRPEKSGTYTVKVTNANGCSSEQSFALTVNEDFSALIANNMLTPNGDGKNDFFVVKNIDMYPNHELIIFDRGGKIMYRKRGYDNSWNGMLNGNPLAEGTYYYVIDFGSGKNVMKGFVTLIRGR